MDLGDYEVFLSHGTMFKVAYRSLSLLCCIHHLKVLAHAIGDVLIFNFFELGRFIALERSNTPEFPNIRQLLYFISHACQSPIIDASSSASRHACIPTMHGWMNQ